MPVTLLRDISFGDCDPAGIVFYPNAFRWMDAAFHQLLRTFGGHAALCERLGVIGIGLVDVSAQFHKPMHDGDRLDLQVTLADWTSRSVALRYEGRIDGTTTFTGREVRCLFSRSETGIVATSVAPLRSLLESQDV